MALTTIRAAGVLAGTPPRWIIAPWQQRNRDRLTLEQRDSEDPQDPGRPCRMLSVATPSAPKLPPEVALNDGKDWLACFPMTVPGETS